MNFNTNQSSYKDFRETLKQRTNQVAVWAGAGLSVPAKLPTWVKLRDSLVSEAHKKAASCDTALRKKIEGLAGLAENEQDFWQAFEYLKSALGEGSYRSSIRTEFAHIARERAPSGYIKYWKLGITAFLTLNIDRFPARAFSEVFPGRAIREFDGTRIASHMDAIRAGLPFVLNLHGNIDDDNSWVFTKSDLTALLGIAAYNMFLDSMFVTRTVLFTGISANDSAIAVHLERIRKAGIRLNGHYWLTTKNDEVTNAWAERIGIRPIFYDAPGGDHSAVDTMMADLERYIPPELPTEPLAPVGMGTPSDVAISPSDLERVSAEEIRLILNRKRAYIFRPGNLNKERELEALWNDFDEAIYRAWSVSEKEGRNVFFGYKIRRLEKRGGFGEIYEGEGESGERVAIKILHGNCRQDKAMLEGFRRGATAMQILSSHHVDGMVPYISAWEIPTCAVMHFIDGPNLEEAIKAGGLDWPNKLRCARDITKIIRSAHSLPERVLHRDIRPANIMLNDLWQDRDGWKVVVLDFDLSWHRDASGYTIPLASSNSGYLAPEQLGLIDGKLTRNALVDSFGLGMTFYFMCSGLVPAVAQHRHTDWKTSLEKNVAGQKCEAWHSVPRRMARLIYWATRDRQSERWDITRILGELQALNDAVISTEKVAAAEMFAEEVVARSRLLRTVYEWDVDKATATVELRSGFGVEIGGDESAGKVRLHIDWANTGDRTFKNVSKYIEAASDRALMNMKKGGWYIENRAIVTGGCRISGNIFTSRLKNGVALDAAADGLEKGLQELRFE